METLLKETLSTFLKIDPASINPATVIDRSAIGNSILLHRLYARFLQQGINVVNYNNILTYGDLVARINGTEKLLSESNNEKVSAEYKNISGRDKNHSPASISLGIDIENINSFERADDYREAFFYKSNFSANEISYCLLQNNALISFAGLFAAKEAIVKADNSYMGVSFSTIEIKHDKQGKPFYKKFSISISHTDNTAVAVAFSIPQIDYPATLQKPDGISAFPSEKKIFLKEKNYQWIFILISLLSLALSIFTILKFGR